MGNVIYTFSIRFKGEKTRILFLGIGQFETMDTWKEAVKAASRGMADELDFRTLKDHDLIYPGSNLTVQTPTIIMLEYTREDLMETE